jgi:c-di-GMP-binding flagellar brake protein YcgR
LPLEKQPWENMPQEIGRNTERTTMDERRVFKRHDKPLSVEFGLIGEKASLSRRNSFQGFVEDISLGGLRLQLRERYGKLYKMKIQGKNVKLAIPFPEFSYTVYTHGEIQWSNDFQEHTEHVITMGIRFIDLSPTDCQYLENYIGSNKGDHNLLWELWNKEVKP